MSGTKSFHDRHRFHVDGRGSVRAGLGLLLLSPYLIWLIEIRQWSWPGLEQWWPALKYSGLQSLASAVLASLMGFVLLHGLQSWRRRSLAEALLLFPNIVPPLFLVMSLLSVFTQLVTFPYGIASVILAHVVLNSGLVAIALDRLLQAKIGGMAETAAVLGAKQMMFWREIAWPQLRGDFACIFLFVFCLSFTSFSIPLLLGGQRAVTLEVAIYDAIRTDGAWDHAVLLAAMQAGILLLLSWLLPTPFWPARAARTGLRFLQWRWASALVPLPAVLLVGGWIIGLSQGATLGFAPEVLNALPASALLTAGIGLATGILHLVLFLLTAYVLPHAGLNRFLNGYLAPSSAITGFGLLLLPVNGPGFAFVKLIVALTLLSYPLLYRWLVHSSLSALKRQTVVARSLGATWTQVLFEVVWPQAASSILRASALAAVWACGDFALSGILLEQETSLPMLIQDLLGNYRFEQAALLLIPLVCIALLIYTLFVRSARYVLS